MSWSLLRASVPAARIRLARAFPSGPIPSVSSGSMSSSRNFSPLVTRKGRESFSDCLTMALRRMAPPSAARGSLSTILSARKRSGHRRAGGRRDTPPTHSGRREGHASEELALAATPLPDLGRVLAVVLGGNGLEESPCAGAFREVLLPQLPRRGHEVAV